MVRCDLILFVLVGRSHRSQAIDSSELTHLGQFRQIVIYLCTVDRVAVPHLLRRICVYMYGTGPNPGTMCYDHAECMAPTRQRQRELLL